MNVTEYSDVYSDWESVTFSIAITIGTILGVVGNIFLLFVSRRYDVFAIDYVTVHLIQQLAMADLIFIFIFLIPILVTHITRKWVFGRTICFVSGMMVSIPACANINFVLAVSLHRYGRCRMNVTEYSDVYSDWESVTFSIAITIGTILGVVGNIFLLFVSRRYDVFAIDYVTVHLIQQLAMADLIFIFIFLIPILVTHITRKWVFGRTICFVSGMMVSIPACANINFVLAVSLHRYGRCRYPLSIGWLDRNRVPFVSSALWLYSSIFTLYVLLSPETVEFFPGLAACQFSFDISYFNFLAITATTLVPFVVITTINIALWVHVREVLRKSHLQSYQALLITSSLTAFFILCWAPTVFRFMFSAVVGEAGVPRLLEKLRYVYFIGVCGNPILYTAVSGHFRLFVRNFIKLLLFGDHTVIEQPRDIPPPSSNTRRFARRASSKWLSLEHIDTHGFCGYARMCGSQSRTST
eukprot:sb/3464413/